MAKELHAELLLIDERKGYRIAGNMGIAAVGLIGVLLKSKSVGHIEQVMPVVDDLREKAGFWINDTFYRQIKDLAKE